MQISGYKSLMYWCFVCYELRNLTFVCDTNETFLNQTACLSWIYTSGRHHYVFDFGLFGTVGASCRVFWMMNFISFIFIIQSETRSFLMAKQFQCFQMKEEEEEGAFAFSSIILN